MGKFNSRAIEELSINLIILIARPYAQTGENVRSSFRELVTITISLDSDASSLLKSLTGQNTQQHIHEKLIEKAKEMLSSTQLSVSEIAFELGFEYSQSFSRLFKSKTNLSPLEFRQSFQ